MLRTGGTVLARRYRSGRRSLARSVRTSLTGGGLGVGCDGARTGVGSAKGTFPLALEQIVAENLRAVRKEQKLSQEVLAKKARVSVSYVSMLERGERSPPLDTLEVLARALRVSPLYLLQELEPALRKKRSR